MLCTKCFQENDNGALFCKHCGSKLIRQEPASDSLSSTLLLVWAIIFFVNNGILSLTQILAYDWYDAGWFVFTCIIHVIHNAANILPAIAIKNNTMKIIAIILVAIPTLYYIFINIGNIFNFFAF